MSNPNLTHIKFMIVCYSLISVGYLYSIAFDLMNEARAQTLEKITIDLYESQYIPISDTTNNLDILINYTTIDPIMSGSTINAVMFFLP